MVNSDFRVLTNYKTFINCHLMFQFSKIIISMSSSDIMICIIYSLLIGAVG